MIELGFNSDKNDYGADKPIEITMRIVAADLGKHAKDKLQCKTLRISFASAASLERFASLSPNLRIAQECQKCPALQEINYSYDGSLTERAKKFGRTGRNVNTRRAP